MLSVLDWLELEFQDRMLCYYYRGSFFAVLVHGNWGVHGSGAHWGGFECHAKVDRSPRTEGGLVQCLVVDDSRVRQDERMKSDASC